MNQQSSMTDDGEFKESRPSSKNPLNWPKAIWMAMIGSFLLLVPFAIRLMILAGVPAIPEPFDVAEFSKWNVPAEEDAFTEYRLATKMREQISTDWRSRSQAEPTNFDVVFEKGWEAADSPLKEWMELHREALAIWKRGTAKSQALNLPPDQLSITTLLPTIEAQRMFVRIALLEQARCIHGGELDEAWEWTRAAYRTGGHETHRGPMIQGLVGAAIHAQSTRGMAHWAEQSELTSGQLKSALADVKSDFGFYERPSNLMKAEYLMMRNTLRSRDWWQIVGPPDFMDANSPSTAVVMRSLFWVVGEPELAIRINRHVLANQLPELDKPIGARRKLVGSGGVTLFDPDPALPQEPGQLAPVLIDRTFQRSLVARSLAPAVSQFDLAILRQVARQAAIQVVLAAQAYRRDHGEFPETLVSLVPDYLEAVPVDPFNPTGGPMLYRRDEAGVAVVWSIGPDGNDGDGGVEVPEGRPGQPADVGFRLK